MPSAGRQGRSRGLGLSVAGGAVRSAPAFVGAAELRETRHVGAPRHEHVTRRFIMVSSTTKGPAGPVPAHLQTH